jgi:hypothetical protein
MTERATSLRRSSGLDIFTNMDKLKFWIIGIITAIGFTSFVAYAASWNLPPVIQQGDLFVATSTSQAVRLPTSTNGSVLWLNPSGMPAWTSSSTFLISSAGNVGIGTGTPASQLTVYSTSGGNNSTQIGTLGSGSLSGIGFNAINAALSTTSYSVTGDGSRTLINAPAAGGNIDFRLNNVSKMFLNSTGFGIGTSTPTFGLTVKENNGSGYSASFAKDYLSPQLAVLNNGGKVGLQGLNASGTLVSDIFFQSSGGNVGIGTMTPGRILELDSTTPLIRSYDSVAGNYWDFGATGGSSGTFQVSNATYNPIKIRGSGTVSIATSSLANAQLWVASGGEAIGDATFNVAPSVGGLIIQGNVGIGTTSPSQMLTVGNNNQFTVSSAGAINAASLVVSGINDYSNFNMTSTGVYGWGSGNIGPIDVGLSRFSAGVLAVGNGTQGSATGTLIAGNIGIGTTTPANAGLTIGAGDVYVASSTRGIILKDTVTGTCYRVQMTSGSLTPTSLGSCP